MKVKAIAVVQARMSSSRLPGKVLADVAGEPMVLRQLARIRAARTLERIIVATSVDPSDDPLVAAMDRAGVEVYRGPLLDVLGRYLEVARATGADRLVRLTADCPLTDPELIDRIVLAHESAGTDYASNVLERTYPRGLDVESVRVDALERVATLAAPEEREHVTLGIYRRPEEFTLTSIVGQPDHSDLRWTVDVPEDLAFVRRVYDALLPAESGSTPGGDIFSTAEILDLLRRRPELSRHEPA